MHFNFDLTMKDGVNIRLQINKSILSVFFIAPENEEQASLVQSRWFEVSRDVLTHNESLFQLDDSEASHSEHCPAEEYEKDEIHTHLNFSSDHITPDTLGLFLKSLYNQQNLCEESHQFLDLETIELAIEHYAEFFEASKRSILTSEASLEVIRDDEGQVIWPLFFVKVPEDQAQRAAELREQLNAQLPGYSGYSTGE